jgi:hypothetical protein
MSQGKKCYVDGHERYMALSTINAISLKEMFTANKYQKKKQAS